MKAFLRRLRGRGKENTEIVRARKNLETADMTRCRGASLEPHKYVRANIRNALEQVHARFPPHTTPRLTVVELGAGKGNASAELAADGRHRVIGLDVVKPKDNWAKARSAGAAMMVADAHNLPLADNSAHFILSRAMHNYCPDKLGVLSEAHRILAPRGIAVLDINPTMPVLFKSGRKRLVLSMAETLATLKLFGFHSRLSPESDSYGSLELNKRNGFPLTFKFAGTTSPRRLRPGYNAFWLSNPQSQYLERSSVYELSPADFERLKKAAVRYPPGNRF